VPISATYTSKSNGKKWRIGTGIGVKDLKQRLPFLSFVSMTVTCTLIVGATRCPTGELLTLTQDRYYTFRGQFNENRSSFDIFLLASKRYIIIAHALTHTQIYTNTNTHTYTLTQVSLYLRVIMTHAHGYARRHTKEPSGLSTRAANMCAIHWP
jgi:hypothetical protein